MKPLYLLIAQSEIGDKIQVTGNSPSGTLKAYDKEYNRTGYKIEIFRLGILIRVVKKSYR